jgi:phosphate starvation-inducible PhoH-like protein
LASKPKPKRKEPEVSLGQLSHVTLEGKQEDYKKEIINNKVTFCHGPAGTSKTFTTIYAALQLLAEGKIGQIILTKPLQESGEKLGFLPGSVEEKIMPYMESYRDSLNIIIGKQTADWLIATEVIKYEPLAYMRGRTFHNCIMILDEAQNADFRQLMLFISRMGKGSRIVVSGDVSQYDISRDKVALPKFIEMMSGIKGLAIHTFGDSDIVRNKILIEITERYDEWKANNKVNW